MLSRMTLFKVPQGSQYYWVLTVLTLTPNPNPSIKLKKKKI